MRQATVGPTLVLLTLFCTPLVSGETKDQSAQQLIRGRLLYRIHCQNCHGEAGDGDGPMAKLLTVQPTDLRALARSNDGDFPGDRVHQAIDGRAEVRAHGMREMPVWGLTFRQADRDSAQESEVQARIGDLVAHLASIQKADR